MPKRAVNKNALLNGAIAGVAGRGLTPFLGTLARPAANLVVGHMQRDTTLSTLGALQGGDIAGGVFTNALGFGNGNGNGGGVLI